MPILLRTILAIAAGIVVGSIVNMSLVSLGPTLVPLPDGVDISSQEGLASAMARFEPRHFIMPFLAHALGTFAGALAAYLIAARDKARYALIIGGFFLIGGIAASFMIGGPAWFIALDLIGAYLPMTWLAIKLGARLQPEQSDPRASAA